MAAEYEVLPAPSYTSPTKTYTNPEILYSGKNWTRKGITLAAGQGVLAAGTVMGQRTADKVWVAYSHAAADGSQVARGLLAAPADTGTDPAGATQQANLYIAGIFKLNMVVGSDSFAMNDLGATADSVLGTYKF